MGRIIGYRLAKLIGVGTFAEVWHAERVDKDGDTPLHSRMYPMPKSLSDASVRNAKPKQKPYKMSDGEGLFLLITPSGSKYWRLKYSFAGKEKLLALGVYPDVTLSDARERRAQ